MMPNSCRTSYGFSLIEVMIAVLVLSFGLLALAALQGTLFRAGADSKARANATAIAQHVVENAKTFAFMTPPTGYAGHTYAALASADLDAQTVGGVEFSTKQEVIRYQYDKITKKFVKAATGGYSPATPEFKQLAVSVSWADDKGATKKVVLTDSVASVAPADAVQVIKTPRAPSRGPEVWIDQPNKDNPQVVPIKIGDGKSAASSNPKPEQFIEEVSAATLFSVQTFTENAVDKSDDAVRLNRKLDVAAVSCVCERGVAVSSATNPAYQVTLWNGKQLAYMEPQAMPAGTPIAKSTDLTSKIAPMCTVCCRDHHENALRQPTPDLYPAFKNPAEHYFYGASGSRYEFSQGLKPAIAGGVYLDACQLIRVNGKMRLAMDAQQNHLMIAALAGTGYQTPEFINKYSGFVTKSLAEGMGTAGPLIKFPAPSTTALEEYSAIVNPPVITLASDSVVKQAAFGLYVDYINADTKKAYECAGGSGTGDCTGLANRRPLEVLPFYAVNVANLGSWKSEHSSVAKVSPLGFDNATKTLIDAGTVTPGTKSHDDVPVTLTIATSNSGLAGTYPIDPDDQNQYNDDAQRFAKLIGDPVGGRASLTVRVATSSTGALSTAGVSAGGEVCSYNSRFVRFECQFDAPVDPLVAPLQIVFRRYTTQSGSGVSAVITDRKVCIANGSVGSKLTVAGANTVGEVATLVLKETFMVNDTSTLSIHILDQATNCPSGTSETF